MAIHYLQHRPDSPILRGLGERAGNSCEYLFCNGARYASVVLLTRKSDASRIPHAVRRYGLDQDRTLHFFHPPRRRDLKATAAAADQQVAVRICIATPVGVVPFDLAQFGPHKNHLRLVQALGGYCRDGGDLCFDRSCCGSCSAALREHTFEQTMSDARSLQPRRIVDGILGDVPDYDMAGLYRGAVALAMPMFFARRHPGVRGLSNDCPVVTSDIRGIREQVGDAALLVDPREPESLAEAIEQVWTDDQLAQACRSRWVIGPVGEFSATIITAN